MKKILSYVIAISIGLLAVAPAIPYGIPMMINSFDWIYLVIASALFGFFLLSRNLPITLKILSVYLFFTCFLSAIPFMSFNAYILIVGAFYFYLACKRADQKIIISMIEAAFWLQVAIIIAQLLHTEKLMEFISSPELMKSLGITPVIYEKGLPIFLGTVMQYMRFASLLALMLPFLMLKNKWYIVPLIIMAALSQSSTLAMSICAGLFVYAMFKAGRWRPLILAGVLTLAAFYVMVVDVTSLRIAFTCGRIPVWKDIVRTWLMDTSGNFVLPLAGPIHWKAIFFGHGIDTFLHLFPVYKHDLNPFPQAHNDFLQLFWEIGLIGTGILLAYIANLIRRLIKAGAHLHLAGLAAIAGVMFFAFPIRMTQTWLLLIAFVVFCEQHIQKEADNGNYSA